MARPNNNRNNNRRMNNYFTRNVQSMGPNFINQLNQQQLERDSINIFRDIARGGVDIEKSYEYLVNERLIGAMEKIAFQNYAKYSEVMSCIKFKIETLSSQSIPVSQETVAVDNEFTWKAWVYERIYLHIVEVKKTGDASLYIALAHQIGRYRHYI